MAAISRVLVALVAFALLLALNARALQIGAEEAAPAYDVSARPAFAEPVTLASKDGVLELTLTVRQGEAHLNTVALPVKNFMLFSYKLERGTASNGRSSGDNLYPGPTLQVFPGEALIVHVNNELTGLTIRDYYNPAYTLKGQKIAIYPPPLSSSPFNLHVHGVHVTPKGNGDNVLLDIQAGMSNTYTYHIPKDMPQGAYWYHSHLHTLTTAQTYLGLAGLLEIGRADGGLPAVTERHIPVRNLILQYNAVFDRPGGLAQINNLNWSQYVSTLTPPSGNQLADGTLSTVACTRELHRLREGDALLHRVVERATVDLQHAWALPIRAEQPPVVRCCKRK